MKFAFGLHLKQMTSKPGQENSLSGQGEISLSSFWKLIKKDKLDIIHR